MGLQDRDYMRERPGRESPFTPPARQASTWRVVAVLLIISGALFVGFDWLVVQRGSASSVEKIWNSIQPKSQTVRSPPATEDPPAGWVACRVNGQVVYSPSNCPRTEAPPLAMQPATPSTQTPVAAQPRKTVTLYHCKAYSGGTFWTSNHCNQHKALIDRMVEVPATLPFHQQVQMAESQRQSAAQLLAESSRSVAEQSAVTDKKSECAALADQILHWDAMARQPQTARVQDWIRTQRHKARDQQFALRC